MLSGNGRHRRPRQAPALVVAAGVTGSAIAIPLLGATGAHAADGTAWDRVAECETGGAWSQNSGNGYYGGLQLSQKDWEAYGGLAYAPSPDEASRSQQIRVAESLLADRGIAAWPTCGPLAGLLGGSPSADTGTGNGTTDDGASDETPTTDSADTSGSGRTTGASPEATATPDSSPSATPSDETPTGKSKSRKSGTSEKTAKSDTSSESEKPTTDPNDSITTKPDDSDNSGLDTGASQLTGTTDSGTGRHRGGTADEDAADGRTTGRHASRGDGATREVQDGSYTVRTGDSLWGIADSLELSGGWHSLYAGNKETVGADPDHILPGQKLAVDVESDEK
jgi:nucleoid-associated protein YgaU